jgi:hypothetical protein
VKPDLVTLTKRVLKDWRRTSLSELVLCDFFCPLKSKNRVKAPRDDKENGTGLSHTSNLEAQPPEFYRLYWRVENYLTPVVPGASPPHTPTSHFFKRGGYPGILCKLLKKISIDEYTTSSPFLRPTATHIAHVQSICIRA